MKSEKLYLVRRDDGRRLAMSYKDICHALGFISSVRFIRITTRGTITFTAAKRHEILDLYDACLKYGFVPSSALAHTAKKLRKEGAR